MTALLGSFAVVALAEMGDKTQLATVALGARFASTLAVTAGTTAGLLAADGLAVLAGARLTERVPLSARGGHASMTGVICACRGPGAC